MNENVSVLLKEYLNKLIDYIYNVDRNYIFAFLGGILIIILLIIISRNKKKKKKKKSSTNEKINATENQIYNPLKNNQNEVVNSNLSAVTIQESKKDNKDTTKKNKKQTRKELKAEEEFKSELQICINAYNQLYTVYYNEGYSVDPSQNSILAYYTSLIQNANEIEELRNISSNISFQTIKIVDEIKCLKEKENIEKQRKVLYDECIVKIAELNKLFIVLNLSGDRTIKEFNERLLRNGMFAELKDYQIIYNDLIQNIEFIKHKYKETLDSLVGKNSNEVDVKLIECLKVLNCNLDETDLSIIKKKYLFLVKKYHPDTNNDSAASIEMSSRINDAYTYIKKTLNKDEKND